MSNWVSVLKRSFFSRTPLSVLISIALLIPLHALSRADQAEKKVMVLCSWKQKGQELQKAREDITQSQQLTTYFSQQLSQNGYDVVDPVAAGLSEQDHERFLRKDNHESSARELAKKFEVNVVGFVYLEALITNNSDGGCKVNGTLSGGGYDSEGTSLGSGLDRTYQVTRPDCERSIEEYQREAFKLMLGTLTSWKKSVSPPLR